MMKPKVAIGIALFFLILTAHSVTQATGIGGGGWIEKVYPETIGNKGRVTLNVIGHLKDDASGKTFKCTPRFSQLYVNYNVEGTVVGGLAEKAYLSLNGDVYDVLTVTFDFSAYPNGISADYEGVLSLSACDDPGTIVSQNVRVVESVNQDLWVNIAGLTTVRWGAKTAYIITYGNMGTNNIDAALLYLAVPKWNQAGDPVHELGFNLNDYKLQPYNPGGLNWGTVSQEMDAQIDSVNYTVYQLLIKDIPPFSFNPLKVTITWGTNSNDFLLKAWWAGSKPQSFHPIWPVK